MQLLGYLLNLCFPKNCVGCHVHGSYLCHDCRAQIKYFTLPLCPGCGAQVPVFGVHPNCQNHTSLDGLYALGRHQGVLRELIKECKYHGHFDVLSEAAKLLASQVPSEIKSSDCLTFVPMHPKQEHARGYNQSKLLAQNLSRELKLPCRSLLHKVKVTQKQAGLGRQARLNNLSQAFTANNRSIKGATITIVDDVATTCTTLNECAKVLKAAGVKKVYGLVLAHGK